MSPYPRVTLCIFGFPGLLCLNRVPCVLQAEDMQQQIIRETFHLVSKRDDNVCNFLEGGRQVWVHPHRHRPPEHRPCQGIFALIKSVVKKWL